MWTHSLKIIINAKKFFVAAPPLKTNGIFSKGGSPWVPLEITIVNSVLPNL